jgi:hypothetical protein
LLADIVGFNFGIPFSAVAPRYRKGVFRGQPHNGFVELAFVINSYSGIPFCHRIAFPH